MNGGRTRRLISVQDISCFGSCSQSVSHAILSSRGIETAMLPTAILSTHTAFSGATCLDLTDEMEKIIAHWKEQGLLFDGVLSGYVSSPRQIEVIRSLGALLHRDGLHIVDPAMADHGKMYHGLGPKVLEGMKCLIREADVILPNLTEAALLSDRPYRESYTEEEIKELLRELTGMGPKIAVITGVVNEQGQIGAAAYDRECGRYSYGFSEKFAAAYPGTGDIFAAVFTAAYLQGEELGCCLQNACDFVKECIRETMGDENHRYGVKFERVLYGENRGKGVYGEPG